MISLKTGIIAASALLLAAKVFAIPDGSPYQAIIERNIFGLNPPPPPQTNNPVTNEGPLNIKFTGITTLGDEKKAWFMVQSKDPKEPPTYLSLPEGERSGPVEVKQILDGSGEVRVITGGKEMTLSFKDHGNKANFVPVPGASPAPAVAGSIPPPPRSAVNPPGVRGANSAIPLPPSRGGTPDNSNSSANSNFSNNSGLTSIPTRPLRTAPAEQPATTAPPLTLEERVALHEVDRIVKEPLVQKGNYPPTPSIEHEDPAFKFPEFPPLEGGGPPAPGGAPPVPR